MRMTPGASKPILQKRTVHTGNSVVRKSVVFKYMSHSEGLPDCARTETGSGLAELLDSTDIITSLLEFNVFLEASSRP